MAWVRIAKVYSTGGGSYQVAVQDAGASRGRWSCGCWKFRKAKECEHVMRVAQIVVDSVEADGLRGRDDVLIEKGLSLVGLVRAIFQAGAAGAPFNEANVGKMAALLDAEAAP
jgi:hypothetical protein